jgi:DNA-binding HxlR family transcriptional regulator
MPTGRALLSLSLTHQRPREEQKMETRRRRPTPPPRDLAIGILEKKWTPDILALLADGTQRFTDLYQQIPRISHKVLIQQLRSLERARLIVRHVTVDGPRNVRYELSPSGRALLPIIDQLERWGRAHLAHAEVAVRRTPVDETDKRRSGETQRTGETSGLPVSNEPPSADPRGA